MSNHFIEEVTTKTLKTVINGSLPNWAYMSLEVVNTEYISLVIGANFDHSCASRFNKAHLKQLIDILQEVHDLME